MEEKQFGAIIVFKPGTSEEAAKKALEALTDLLEYPARLRNFNPEHGHPVFYVP